jgi:hypothetical protein
MYSGDEVYSDDITSGETFEGELEQADFERSLEDYEDEEGGRP